MDHIRQALDRAKQLGVAEKPPNPPAPVTQEPARLAPQVREPEAPVQSPSKLWTREVFLNSAHLIANRIVAHDVADVRSRPFDMLRTQVLHSMDKESWQNLGVTSPSPACGKSVISANLALSMARQPGRSVLLVDMDLQKPQLARYLGLQCDHGLVDVLENKVSLSKAITRVSVRNKHLLVLPTLKPTIHSSEWMASKALATLFEEIARDYKDYTVIFDLPPILASDDVIAILPRIDCALFVAAVGVSSLAEIKECNKHLDTTPVVQVVVNKAPDTATEYYYVAA